MRYAGLTASCGCRGIIFLAPLRLGARRVFPKKIADTVRSCSSAKRRGRDLKFSVSSVVLIFSAHSASLREAILFPASLREPGIE